MRFVPPAATFAVAVLVGHAEAQEVAAFESGDQFLAKCDQSADFCSGFVEAAADAMNAARSSGGTVGGWTACIPAGAMSDQVRDIAMTYLRNHPEQRHASAASLIASALANAFPCPPGQPVT